MRVSSYPILLSGMRYYLIAPTKDYIETRLLFRVGSFALWLALLQAGLDIELDLQSKVQSYQNEIILVLGEAFHEGRLINTPTISRLIEEDHEIVKSYKSTIHLLVQLRSRIYRTLSRS